MTKRINLTLKGLTSKGRTSKGLTSKGLAFKVLTFKVLTLCIFLLSAQAAMGQDQPSPIPARPERVETAEKEAPKIKETKSPSNPHLLGGWPSKMPKITINQAKGSVGDAIRTVSRKTRWGLVISAPPESLDKPITIQVSRHPAVGVLAMILQGGSLQAKLKEGVLVITSNRELSESGPHKIIKATKDKSTSSKVDSTEKGGLPSDVSRAGEAVRKAEAGSKSGGVGAGVSLDKESNGASEKSPIKESSEDLDAAKNESPDKKREDQKHPSRRKGRRDRIVVGGSLKIKQNEEADSAVVIGGTLTVLGRVHKEAVAVGGSVILEPGSEVMGDAVAVGGEVIVKKGAVIHGDRVSVGGSLKGVINVITGVATGSVSWFMFSIVGTIVRALILFLLALMILSFMPDRSRRIEKYLSEHPGTSTLGGVALALGFIPFCVLLAITIVGILAIPFAILGLIGLHIIGLTVFMTWFGHKVPLFGKNKSPVVAMTIGLAAITLIDIIPGIGSIIVLTIAFISAGAALLSKLGDPPKNEYSGKGINPTGSSTATAPSPPAGSSTNSS